MKSIMFLLIGISTVSIIGCASISPLHTQKMIEAQTQLRNCSFDAAIAAVQAIPADSLSYALPSLSHVEDFPSVKGYPRSLALEYLTNIKAAFDEHASGCLSQPESSGQEASSKLHCLEHETLSAANFPESKYWVTANVTTWTNRCHNYASAGCTPAQDVPFGINADSVIHACLNVQVERLKLVAQTQRERESREGSERQAVEQQAQADYVKSPAGISDRLCQTERIINVYREQMRKEKEAGKVSGYVSPGALNKFGRSIVSWMEAQTQLKDEYRKAASGKQWSPTSCQSK